MGGVFGKSDAPKTPDYKGAALATSNSGKYNEVGPYGSVGWTFTGKDPKNPQAGDYTRTTQMSPEQLQLYKQETANRLQAGGLAGAQMADLAGGRAQMQDSLYRRATQYYDKNFGNEGDQLRTQLLNSGLADGSAGYQNAMDQFHQRKDTAYADAADRAVAGADNAQNNSVNRLSSILSMAQGTIPQSLNSSGGSPIDFTGAAQSQFTGDMNRTNADNAQAAGNFKTAMTAAQMAAMFFSDRRLKSDIKRLGVGFGGLPTYEYTIFGERERGYMADEVEQVLPSAVAEVNGIKMVNYSMLGGRP